MAFKPVLKKQTWYGYNKTEIGHLGRLYMQTNKTSSTKNAGTYGRKRCTVRRNARKLSWGKTTKDFKNYATE